MSIERKGGGRLRMTGIYSVLHLLIDGLCALAMFGAFLRRENGYLYILLYNFCAFALQMPFGVILDALGARVQGRRQRTAFLTAAAGALCTAVGVFVHPVILGIGNALFHVGAGVGVIEEDFAGNWQSKGLGTFVAPGAMGLYLGTLIARAGIWKAGFWTAGILTAILCAVGGYRLRQSDGRAPERCGEKAVAGSPPETGRKNRGRDWKKAGGMAACCMAVVILRSYIGMTVSFPWKTGIPAGTLAVLAVVGGKVAGGFAAAEWGMRRAAAVSLGMAAVCYLFSAVMPIGLAAVFLFNMTMPMTLYWLVCRLPDSPGLAFGILTFALFLGFLPGYFGLGQAVDGRLAGCVGSVLSLVLLGWMGRRRKWELI